jgi:4-methylaminobutanoate oxidase (formaldehyde-forming)
MKIVVVGGGIIGASIAWHLAREGVGEVVLLERDRLGSGTTWHSAGNITWKPLPDHDAQIMYALETIPRVEAESGRETGWLRTGRTFVARSERSLADLAEFDRAARERGIAARWLEPGEVRRVSPLLDPAAARGIWLNPLSGRVNPADLAAAYAAAARRAGARIVEQVEVARLVLAGGRVVGVETAEGRLEADLVVVAAGLWSRALLDGIGVALAQWACEHFYVIADVSPPPSRDMPSFVAPDDLIYGREEVGRLLFGCFDEAAITLDPERLPQPFAFTLLPPLWDKLAPYIERAMHLIPALEAAGIRHFVNGPETFTPDGRPLIGRVAGVEGLMVATALNSTGVTWSAMAGALVADLAAGRTPRFDAARYDPQRFGAKAGDVDWLKSQVSAIVSSGYRSLGR